MKTQYRHPATMSVYATIRHLHADRARWKRKNRIKQLKRTIERYKHGTMLPKLEALRSAYTQLQYLRKPKTTEDWTKWDFYLSQLKVLQDNIQRAIIDASMYYGEALYKSEHRKEQSHD